MDTTIDGKKVVDSQAMWWVQYEAQSGRREVRLYRLRRVSNSKKASFKFRITNITDVMRAFAP
jgi:hypothetical protein